MGSRKPSAKARRKKEFEADFDGSAVTDDMFTRESRRAEEDDAKRKSARSRRACKSKKRYESRMKAEEAIASCAEYGTPDLHCYKCPYCNGWHLTSKKQGGTAQENAD